jgi:hypothetical protein
LRLFKGKSENTQRLKEKEKTSLLGSVFLLFERRKITKMEWSACSDEYEKLVIRMTTPRFVSLKTFMSLLRFLLLLTFTSFS